MDKKWMFGLLALAGLAAPAPARAGLIFGFAAKVAAADSTVPLGAPGSSPVTLAVGTSGGLTYLPKASGSETTDGDLGDDINFGGIHFSPGSSSTLRSFSHDFALEVTITDAESGESGAVWYYGRLSGSLRGGSAPSIISTLLWRSSPTGMLSAALPPAQALSLGANLYTIDFKGATTPSRAADGVLQSLVLGVTVVPEPSSFVLAGAGFLGVLAGVRRSRRPR